MAKASGEWKVLRHGPIERLAENLWRVTGTVPRISLRRTMTIARMSDGRLVIHNAIAMEEPAMKEIEAWGTPAFLLVPNAYHRLDAPAYKKRYPALTVLAPRGSRRKVEEVQPVDGTLEDFPRDPSVWLEPVQGIADVEGAMFVRSPDGVTIVLNDVVFNMDRKRDPLGFLFTTLLGSAPGPRISRLVKAMMVKDRAALRADLGRMAGTRDLVRLVVAHEKVASGEAERRLPARMNAPSLRQEVGARAGSGGARRMAALLDGIVPRPALHARFVNTLARLEYIGVRKMVKSRRAERLDLDGLQHLLDEAVHALRLKKAAVALAQAAAPASTPGGAAAATFSDADTLAGAAGEDYFQALDRRAEGAVADLPEGERAEANYLLTSAAVEVRAQMFYPLYEERLRAHAAPFSVAAIMKDEAGHLTEMSARLAALLPDWRARLQPVLAAEEELFEPFLAALEREAAASTAAASRPPALPAGSPSP